jgi:hypothetical protein
MKQLPLGDGNSSLSFWRAPTEGWSGQGVRAMVFEYSENVVFFGFLPSP